MKTPDELWKTYDWNELQADRDMFHHVLMAIQADAYAAGQEAMRERCAEVCDRRSRTYNIEGERWEKAATALCATTIRALTPEPMEDQR